VTALQPNSSDIDTAGLEISGFPEAWGCASPDGAYRPSIDLTRMWMMIPTTREEMASIWKRAGISKAKCDSFPQMLESEERNIRIACFKVKRGLFKTAWIGDVRLEFDTRTVFIGRTARLTQSQMWQHFRSFLDDTGGSLHDSTAAAIAALSS
jgi:hypothetical protein